MSASSTPSAEDSAGIAGFTAAIHPAGHVRRCGRALPCHDLDGEPAGPDSEGALGELP